MTQENDLERIEELVNKGISFQREGKHKEAIVCFDKAISLDENRNGEVDSNLLLLKNNSVLKIDEDN
jgi:tetratricopeptide (TPR) repeat protein